MNLLPHIFASVMKNMVKNRAIEMSLGIAFASLGLIVMGYFGFAFLEPIYGRVLIGCLIGFLFLVVGILLVALSKRSKPDPLKTLQETVENLFPHLNASQAFHQTASKNIKVAAPVLLVLGLYLSHVFKEWWAQPK